MEENENKTTVSENKKTQKLQIRINANDKKMLTKIREKDVKFNASSFFRECLLRKYNKEFLPPVINP